MKKNIYLLYTLFLSLLLLWNCKDENNSNNHKYTLKATCEQNVPDSKTILANDNNVLWSAGDALALFSGDNTINNKFDLVSGENTTSAVFSGSVSTTGAVYAFYPHSFVTGITTEKTINFSLPASQVYNSAGGFSNNLNPAAAYRTSGSESLQFLNIGGYLVVQLKVASESKTITRITVTSASKKLSGNASIAMNYTASNAVMNMASEASNSVYLDLGSGVELNTTAKKFYILLPPALYPVGDITVNITSSGGSMTKTNSGNAITITRSMITVMNVFDFTTSSSTNYIENGVDYGAGTTFTALTIGGVSGKTLTVAPVNCGYEALNYPYGKLFQWGRKQGQGGVLSPNFQDAINATVTETTVTNSAGSDNSNAAVFYKVTTPPYSWSSENSSLTWNAGSEASPTKSPNDPCPEGWRLPTKAEISALLFKALTWTTTGTHGSTININGRTIDGGGAIKSFLPTTGNRGGAGELAGRSTIGFYWTSTKEGTNANYFFLSEKNAGINTYAHSGAFAVRCVK